MVVVVDVVDVAVVAGLSLVPLHQGSLPAQFPKATKALSGVLRSHFALETALKSVQASRPAQRMQEVSLSTPKLALMRLLQATNTQGPKPHMFHQPIIRATLAQVHPSRGGQASIVGKANREAPVEDR